MEMKKVAAWLLAAGLGFSISWTGCVTYAGTNSIVRQTEQSKWNQTEIKAYQYESTNKYEKYLASGGEYLYNKNFQEKDQWIKITVDKSGYFAIATESEDQEKIELYDASKQRVLAKTTSDGDLEYGRLVKEGEIFYIKLPQKIDKVILRTGVIKDGFGTMQESDTYYESGKGIASYHSFSINKRSAVEFNISAIERKGGITYAYIEKKENGQWKRLDNTVKIKPASYDDDFVHGMTKGEYRLVVKAPAGQLNAVSYTKSSTTKKVAYKKSKAKNIKKNTEKTNIYTTGEKAARWYKVKVTSAKKKRILNIGKDTVSGGYKATIYQNKKKKPIKTIKVTGNANAKIAKLPKKKGTYYIRISKLTSKTNGTYEIGYY